MNLRPSGYEPDELPGCSIPRQWFLPGYKPGSGYLFCLDFRLGGRAAPSRDSAAKPAGRRPGVALRVFKVLPGDKPGSSYLFASTLSRLSVLPRRCLGYLFCLDVVSAGRAAPSLVPVLYGPDRRSRPCGNGKKKEERLFFCLPCVSKTWRRPTLPHLKMQYHRR